MLSQRQAIHIASISASTLALLWPGAAWADLYVIEQNGFSNPSGSVFNPYFWQIPSAGTRGSTPASFLGLQNKPTAFMGNVSIVQNGLIENDMAGPLLMATFGEPLNAGTFSTAAMTAPRIATNLNNLKLNLTSAAAGGKQAAFNLPLMTSQAFQTPSGSNGIDPPWPATGGNRSPFVTFGVITNGTAGYYKDGTRANNNWVNYAGGNAGNIDYSLTTGSLSVSGTAAPGTGSGLPWEPAGGALYLGAIGGNGGGSRGGSLDGGKGGDVTANLYGIRIQMTGTGTPQAPFVGITAASVGGQAGICCVYDTAPNFTIDTSASVLPRWSMTWGPFYDGGGDPVINTDTNLGSRVTRYGENGAGGSASVSFAGSSLDATGQNLVGITASSAGGATQIPTNIPGSGNWVEVAYAFGGPSWFVDSNKDPKNLAINYPGSAGNATVNLTGSSISLTGSNLIGVLASSAASPFLIPTNVRNFFGVVPTAGKVGVNIDSGSKISISNPTSSGFSAGLVAVSTGGSVVLPFSQEHVIQNRGLGLPAGFGYGSDVNITNAGAITVSGNTGIGILGLSSANSGGLRQAGSFSGNGGSPVAGAKAGNVTVVNTGKIDVQGGNAVGLAAISAGAGGVVHSLPTASQGQPATLVNGGGNAPTNRFIVATLSSPSGAVSETKPILSGSPSAHSGDVSVTNTAGATIQAGNWDLSSKIGYGILAQSVGGGGGLTLGGASGLLGSNGNAQGNGGTVSVVNRGSVLSFGDSAVGVLAQSIGGGGGAGANSDSLFVAKGSRGGSGGDGGAITLAFEKGSSVVTNGDDAIGVMAQSVGGGGGQGGGAKAYGLFIDTAVGGSGGTGGNGGSISLTNSGKTFWTAGQHAHGLVLQSTGGGGGTGGSANTIVAGVQASASVSLGGTGGSGGSGGTIGPNGQSNPIESTIVTNDNDSTGIILQSIGMGGGIGGKSSAKNFTVAAGTFDPELSGIPTLTTAFSLGGSGGTGGKGGAVNYWHTGTIATYGGASHGLMAQSIGGGGGSGGDATASAHAIGSSVARINLSFGLGGSAGSGTDGGNTWLQIGTAGTPGTATIQTTGHDSMAVLAQSIGAGGGNAGTGSGLRLSVSYQPTGPGSTAAAAEKAVASGSAGDAGEEFATAATTTTDTDGAGGLVFETSAMQCLKVLPTSTAGGQPSAGCGSGSTTSSSQRARVKLEINVGRKGGSGGSGGSVTVQNNGALFTTGSGSSGILSQSVGGGGGKAAAVGPHASGGLLNMSIAVGGTGGSGGGGGEVSVINQGTGNSSTASASQPIPGGWIRTGLRYDLDNPAEQDATRFTSPAVTGGDAHGIHAQSIGGGGGIGGHADPQNSAVSSSMVADLVKGKHKTAELKALGIGDDVFSDIASGAKLYRWRMKGISPVNLSFRPSITVGGAGGTGGDGGKVSIENFGTIETFGPRSYGVFGQSIGGGGGTGAGSSSPLIDLAGSETLLRIDFSPSINVGGNGGAAGNGGSVTVNTGPGNAGATSKIVTHGYAALGIAAQSVGGGGGTAHEGSTFGLSDRIGVNGTISVIGGVDFGNGQSEASYNATAATATANGKLTFGSQSTNTSYGNSGAGGLVSLGAADKPMQGIVTTHGDDAMAVFGQSLGGGGGLASLGCSNSSPVNGAHDASACWGNTTVEGGQGQPGLFVGAAGAGGIDVSVNGGSGSQTEDNTKTGPGSAGVTIFDGQQITTHGARSMGMVSQSISGGGGFFSGPNRRINSVTMPAQQRTSIPAGATTITLKGSGITTYGDGSWGVLAQTIKGGGGFFGDSAQELAFNIKYDVNKPAATNVLAGETPNPTPKFGQNRVGDPRWNVSGCENTPTCSITSLNPGTVYRIPFSQGTATWAPGDYLTLEPSNDASYPYAVKQYTSSGVLKTSLGKGRILNISANAFLLEGDDRNTGQVYGANTLVAGPMTIAGVPQPTLSQANQYLFNYYTLPGSTVNTAYLASSDGWSTINPVLYPGLPSTPAPAPSTMNVSMANSAIATYGRNAHGMVLQNLGSVGGAWSASGTPLNLGISMTGGNTSWLTPGGNVNLTLDASSISTFGPQSRGVIIQSDGAGPGGAGGRGQIAVSLQNKSLIYAGKHTALMLVGGSYKTSQRNKISVDGTSSIQNGAYINAGAGSTVAIDDSDSSYNKWAVYAPAGYTNLEVAKGGTIYGNILLGITTKGDFTNDGDWHGSTFIGANQSLHNYGRVFAGGGGTTSRLHIDGSLKHHRGGEIHIDVHPASQAAPHDALSVTGLAKIEGTIVPQTQSLMPGNYEVLQTGSLEYSGNIRDSHVFDWRERVENNTLVKTPHADFTPPGYGLNRSQKSLAGYLQRAWENADRSHIYQFGYLHEHESGAHHSYKNTLTQLSGQVLNSQAIQMKTGFSNLLGQGLACPNDKSSGTTLSQDHCIWAEAIGSIADQSDQDSSPSYRAEAAGVRLGGQKQLGNQWQAGFSFGYANNTLTATGFNSSGTFADASVSAQKTIGAWTLGGSMALAQGWFDNKRTPQLYGNDAAASLASTYRSDSSMTIFGMRLRAAHTTVLKTSTIKPYIDLDLSFNHQPGYDETGDLLALSAETSQQFNVAITPMVEFGFSKLTLGDLKLEGFVSAGASILPTNTINTSMAFRDAATANGSFDAVTDGPPLLGRLNLGLQLYKGNAIEARAEYGLQAGSGYWDQRVGAKLLYRF